MAATPDQLETFAPITWATPYITSPRWHVSERNRTSDPTMDRFCGKTLYANDGVSNWVEMYLKPEPGESVKRTISLLKFGNGLMGFAGICHGGATLSFLDEGLGYSMVVNEAMNAGSAWSTMGIDDAFAAIKQGKPMAEVLKGLYVTAKLEIQFLQPVMVPGLVGIETQVLESKGHKMKMRAIMKDAKGTPLMQADGVWVKIGGGIAKL
jgi:acyl-coenzyme A thioesterase PaaI-like protein